MRKVQAVIIAGVLVTAAALVGAQAGGEASSGKSASDRALSASVERGKEVYRTNCGICHYSTSEKQKIGPGMKNLYKRGKYADGRKVDDASMRAWIETGTERMPPFKGVITSKELSDLIAYLKTL